MGDLGVDHVLVVDVINLLGLDDLPLVEKLESIVLSGLLVLRKLDFAKSA